MLIAKKNYIFIMAAGILILMACCICHLDKVHAEEEKPLIRIEFGKTDKGTLTNDQGQTLNLDKNGKISGNIPIIRKGLISDDYYFIMIDFSSKLTFVPSSGKDRSGILVDVLYRGYSDDDYYPGPWFETDSGVKQVTEIDGNHINAYVESSGYKYYCIGMHNYIGYYIHDVWVKGYTSGKVSLFDTSSGIKLTGAKNLIKYTCEINDYSYCGRMFLFEDNYIFKMNKEKNLLTAGNIILPDETSYKKDNVKNLYLRPANGGKNMFLTWRMVDKAKSYVIYAKNGKRFRKEKVENGHEHNYYNISDAVKNKVYCYKVMAFSKPNGKGKKLCKKAYPVSAVTTGSKKVNASSIKINKNNVKLRVGKKKTVKALLKWPKGGKPLSEKVQWRIGSGSKKIIKLKCKGNKCVITGKRKGTVSIWAKTHNGINSKIIEVTVK